MSQQPQDFGQSDSELSIFEELDEPPMYKVILHNDDFTPMEFVVEILIRIFHRPAEVAEQIMLRVHQTGAGVCGIYTFDIAETKTDLVHKAAEKFGYPLRASLEEA